ncbi:HTH-type transcriptional regulator PuuR [Neomoorella glycerini]|uniref:HTH-type transcriptional regulator PuuR n=1 Tax=Neomoorella glycerini TaxID=55779 RepID=A0A6I5ZN11_9FIRM|nr:XRE family transcriptional regulator [Moorella glycerini]QGP91213.1 HTH-type transcriptional regulator PuuR [Moorella glycerini]
MDTVGKRIRSLRKQRGLSLQELAAKVGISYSYLSQIENGKANLSVSLLKDLASALEVPSVFFLLEDDIRPLIKLIKQEERQEYVRNEGVTIELLFAAEKLEATIIKLQSGSATNKSSCHQGEEFCYVLKGEVEICFDEKDYYQLKQGDIIYYPAHIPHRWFNHSEEPAIVLLACTPPSF